MVGVSNSIDRFNGLVASLAIKAPCVAVAIANITLSGEQTVNGVAVVSGDRVLVTAQTSSVDNGIYDVSSGAWARSADFDGNRDVVSGTFVTVATATVGRNPYYQVTTANPITIGTTAINFTLADGPNVSYPLTPVEDAGGLTDDDIDDSIAPAIVPRYGTNTTPGTTPMQTAFVNGLSAYDSVYAPSDQYLFGPGSAVSIAAGKTLYGDGYSSQIISNTEDDNQLTVTGSNTAIRKLRITSGGKLLNESDGTKGACIWAKGTSHASRLENLTVDHCFIENGHFGINIDYFDSLKVAASRFYNSNAGWTQIHAWDCKSGSIDSNCHFDGQGVMGNHIGLWGPTAAAEKSESWTISGATFVDCKFEAIQMMGSHHSVTGCTLRHLAGLSTSVGVQVRSKGTFDDTKGNNVSDNTFSGFRYGIFLHHFDDIDTEGPKNTTLSGNNIADGLGYGYLIKNEAHGTNIQGGNVSNILATFTAGDGVRIQSDQVKCEGVFVTGCANDGIAIVGTRSNVELNINTVEGNTGDGIVIDASAIDIKLIGTTALNNGGWGIQTNGAVLSANEGNTASGNTTGQINSPILALDDTGTPSAAGAKTEVRRTGGTTTITDILGCAKGDIRIIHVEHTVTFSVAGNLNGGTTNLDAVDGDVITWCLDNNGTTWNLQGFVRNGIDNSGGA